MAAPASAQQPESTPGGPWVQPKQHESLSAIRDYDELVSTLERLVARSHGAAEFRYRRSAPRAAVARSRSSRLAAAIVGS